MVPVLLRLNGDPEPPTRLDQDVTLLGRDPACSIVLLAPTCSRRHAELRVLARPSEGVPVTLLVDLDSRNGTFVNGERVRSHRLVEHDVLELGGFRFVYLCRTAAELAAEERLLDLATRDGLTGLANRATFTRETEREFARALRFGRAMSLVLLDLDRLKLINDRFGHAVGDAALLALGTAILAELRRYDLAARLGGDEFALVLPETSAADALLALGRVQARLGGESVPTTSGPLRVSVTGGVADLSGAPATISELFLQADRALYSAKAQDRGRGLEVDATMDESAGELRGRVRTAPNPTDR